MDSLTAVFLGMTAFKPGRATVQGTLVGVVIIGMLDNGLNLLGAPFYLQNIVRGVVMVAWIVGIHFIEANFLNPKIIGTAAKIHPVLVIFSLILGEKSYGLIGALFAVPVLSIISVVFMFFYKRSWRDGRPPTGAVPTIAAPPAPPAAT